MMSRIVNIIALCVLLSEGRKFGDAAKAMYWNEIQESGMPMKAKELYESDKFPIPFNDAQQLNHIQNILLNVSPAAMARYIVNQADWGAVATISVRKDVESFPVANLISIADGPVGNGTGIPYMYLTPFDYTAQDLAKDHRATVLVSLAEGSYCKNKNYDPMDPRCARVLLTGKITAVKNQTKEHDVAEQLFFGRHPKLQNMPADHKFFLAKLDISTIAMLDTFGGPKYISVEDYMNVTAIRKLLLSRKKWLPFITKSIF